MCGEVGIDILMSGSQEIGIRSTAKALGQDGVDILPGSGQKLGQQPWQVLV